MPSEQRPQKRNARSVVKEFKLPTKSWKVLSVSDIDADPDELPIDINETFIVSVEKKCHMIFEDNDLFDDQHYPTIGPRSLSPKPNQSGTAWYHTAPHTTKAGKKMRYTHSIKVG